MHRHLPAAILFLTLVAAPFVSAKDAAYLREIRVTPLLKTCKDSAGHKLSYPVDKAAEVTAVLVEIPAGAVTGWHVHPVPCFAYVQEGKVEVELACGKKKTIRAGEAFSEVVNLIHNGKNPGPATAKLVLFAVGTKGTPFAIKKCCRGG